MSFMLKGRAQRQRAMRSLRSRPLRLLQRAARRRKQFKLFPFRKPTRIYGRIGNLEVVLARSHADVRRAQRLRFEVFYREMAAIPDAMTSLKKRDEDDYDSICDHLLVVDTNPERTGRPQWPRRSKVVGTYRVLGQAVAERHQGFYTQNEFDIAPLIARKRSEYSFMELGRSCVLKPYRNRRTVELLWQGLWTYVRERGADVMIGCASFPGTDPEQHAMALSFLHHNVRAPEEWRVSAHPQLFVDMNRIPKGEIDTKAALKGMPPLIKGYIRLGAFVGDGAVIDRQFGTTDVLIVMPVESIQSRYFSHFGAPDENLTEAAVSRRRDRPAARGGVEFKGSGFAPSH